MKLLILVIGLALGNIYTTGYVEEIIPAPVVPAHLAHPVHPAHVVSPPHVAEVVHPAHVVEAVPKIPAHIAAHPPHWASVPTFPHMWHEAFVPGFGHPFPEVFIAP